MCDRNGLLRAAATILPLALVTGCSSLPGGREEEHSIVVGHHQRSQFPRPCRRLGRLLGAVPEHLPDPDDRLGVRHLTRARRRQELRLHRRGQQGLPLRAALRAEVLQRRAAGRRARQALLRLHHVPGGAVRPGAAAGRPRRGRDPGRAHGGLPPEETGRDVPVPVDHPRDLPRGPRRVPGCRPAPRHPGHRLGAVHPEELPAGQAGRPGQEPRLQGPGGAAQRHRHHPLLLPLRPDGRRPEGRPHRPHLPRPDPRTDHGFPGGGLGR